MIVYTVVFLVSHCRIVRCVFGLQRFSEAFVLITGKSRILLVPPRIFSIIRDLDSFHICDDTILNNHHETYITNDRAFLPTLECAL